MTTIAATIIITLYVCANKNVNVAYFYNFINYNLIERHRDRPTATVGRRNRKALTRNGRSQCTFANNSERLDRQTRERERER